MDVISSEDETAVALQMNCVPGPPVSLPLSLSMQYYYVGKSKLIRIIRTYSVLIKDIETYPSNHSCPSQSHT